MSIDVPITEDVWRSRDLLDRSNMGEGKKLEPLDNIDEPSPKFAKTPLASGHKVNK